MLVTGRKGKALADIQLAAEEGKTLGAKVSILDTINVGAKVKLDVVGKDLVANVKLPEKKMALDLVIKPEDITTILKAVDGKVIKFLMGALMSRGR